MCKCCTSPSEPVHSSKSNLIVRRADARWVREFMGYQGQAVVANYLANMSKKGIKGPIEIELEHEILKFFKKSLSNKVSTLSCSLLISERGYRLDAGPNSHSRPMSLAHFSSSTISKSCCRDSGLLLPLGRRRSGPSRSGTCAAGTKYCRNAPQQYSRDGSKS
jgi:hypothetical protein